MDKVIDENNFMPYLELYFPHTLRFYRELQLDSLTTNDIKNLHKMGFVISEEADTYGKILLLPQPFKSCVKFGATPEYCTYNINNKLCFEIFILSCGNQIVYVPDLI